MAKNDYAKIKSEIGSQLVESEIKVTGAGGRLEIVWPTSTARFLKISVLGRTGKINVQHAFALEAVRSVEYVTSDE